MFVTLDAWEKLHEEFLQKQKQHEEDMTCQFLNAMFLENKSESPPMELEALEALSALEAVSAENEALSAENEALKKQIRKVELSNFVEVITNQGNTYTIKLKESQVNGDLLSDQIKKEWQSSKVNNELR